MVASNLDVTAPASGQECSLTAGDVVMRLSDTPDNNQNVTASVQSSKQGDCAAGQTVAIGVQDLQEMHNQFREQLDSGLKTLADKAGTGGLPKAPDTATTSGRSSAAGARLGGSGPTPGAAAAGRSDSRRRCSRTRRITSSLAVACTLFARRAAGGRGIRFTIAHGERHA